jgi:hypothetical protein
MWSLEVASPRTNPITGKCIPKLINFIKTLNVIDTYSSRLLMEIVLYQYLCEYRLIAYIIQPIIYQAIFD